MKKYYILLVLFIVSGTMKAQTTPPITDTATYLVKEIEGKKNKYIGKPFSVLLDSLKLQPRRIVMSYPPADSLKGDEGRLDFNSWTDVFEDRHYLLITWQHPRPYFDTFMNVIVNGTFQDLLNLYKNVIIKDIEAKDYSEEEPRKHYVQ